MFSVEEINQVIQGSIILVGVIRLILSLLNS